MDVRTRGKPCPTAHNVFAKKLSRELEIERGEGGDRARESERDKRIRKTQIEREKKCALADINRYRHTSTLR